MKWIRVYRLITIKERVPSLTCQWEVVAMVIITTEEIRRKAGFHNTVISIKLRC